MCVCVCVCVCVHVNNDAPMHNYCMQYSLPPWQCRRDPAQMTKMREAEERGQTIQTYSWQSRPAFCWARPGPRLPAAPKVCMYVHLSARPCILMHAGCLVHLVVASLSVKTVLVPQPSRNCNTRIIRTNFIVLCTTLVDS